MHFGNFSALIRDIDDFFMLILREEEKRYGFG